MTTADRDIYRGLAQTFRTLAGGDLAIAGIARNKGDRRAALARIRSARNRVREARRWEALAKLGA